jgi:hypothetical protein
LWEKGLVGADYARDILAEGADGHGVGHAKRQRMVKLHFFTDFSSSPVAQEPSSSWVVGGKGCHIKDAVLED